MTRQFIIDSEFISQDSRFKNIPCGYIDKQVTGCGLTSVALENEEDTILLVPKRALVDNKVKQYPNKRFKNRIFGVCGGIFKDDVDVYINSLKSGDPIKIICTYDSVYKVEHLIDRCRFIIDESDQVLKLSKLKTVDKEGGDIDAINYMMRLAHIYKDKVSFISATPPPIEYMPSWVSELDQIQFKFTNIVKVYPILLKRTNPYKSLGDELLKPLKDEGSVTLGDRTFSKVIIFINSVDNILKVIRDNDLPKEEVGILCSDSTRNALKIKGYNKVEDILTKYTFITSVGFEGIDLYDKEAMNVVVSNTSKAYQIVDIYSSLKQATSRQRIKSNPNYNRYVFIYNQNLLEEDEEAIKDAFFELEKIIKDNCTLLNDLKDSPLYDSTLKQFNRVSDFRQFTLFVDGVWEINEVAFKAMEYEIFEMRKQFLAGFNMVGSFEHKPIIVEAPKVKREKNPYSYLSILEKYKQSLEEEIKWSDDEIECDSYKLIDSYYKLYGKLTNNSAYAKQMVGNIQNDYNQLVIEVNRAIKCARYKWSDLKKTLSNVYKKQGLTKSIKITDLDELGIQYSQSKSKGLKYVTITSKSRI